MWHNNRVVRDKNVELFDMPALKDDCLVGRSADHIEREAYERGFQAGEKAGFEMGSQKARVVLEKIEAVLKELTSLRASLAVDLESQCAALAVSMAKRIVKKEIAASPKEMVAMAKEGLTRLERSGQMTIKIHPSLKDLFLQHRPELLNVHPDIVFDLDPTLPQFGAVVVGPAEEVVTDLDEQLKNLIKDMVEKHGGR